MDPTHPIVRQAVLCAVATTCAVGAVAARPATPPPSAAPPAAAPARPALPVLTVPSVVGEAFVFAKGELGDAGFAWKVAGRVHGYSSNTVVGQSPAAGTKVLDTGMPPVTVVLKHIARYSQDGTPQDTSPFPATRLRLAKSR